LHQQVRKIPARISPLEDLVLALKCRHSVICAETAVLVKFVVATDSPSHGARTGQEVGVFPQALRPIRRIDRLHNGSWKVGDPHTLRFRRQRTGLPTALE
jgi:hypothetical protein